MRSAEEPGPTIFSAYCLPHGGGEVGIEFLAVRVSGGGKFMHHARVLPRSACKSKNSQGDAADASVRACLLDRDAGVFLAIRFAAEKASSSTECSPGNKASCSACARTRSTSTSRNARDATGDGAHRSEEVARTVVVVSGDLRDAGPLEDLVGLVLRPLHLHTVKSVSVLAAGVAIATGLGARMVVAAEIELPKGRRMRGGQKKTVLSRKMSLGG